MTALIEKLEATREGYEQEQQYQRLLIDAYSGGGGFAGGTVQPPSGFWGPAAEAYSARYQGDIWTNANRLTYLDRYPREDDKRFQRRIQVAHYPNYIQPLTDLKCSFILRKPFMVTGRPQRLVDWRSNVDGRGTSWDELLPMLALQAATFGWLPVVVDMPPAPEGEITRAMASDLGLVPSVVPLFPANLTDYQVGDDGLFDWAKIRTDYVDKPDPMGPAEKVTRYTIWYRDSYDQYVVRGEDKMVVSQELGNPHTFGEVPIAIFQHKPMLEDPVRGLPMHGQESIEARRLFNLHSELDEHMRSQVFAVLVLAMEADENKGEISLGTENALALDPSSTQKHYFMSPDGSVAASYETRIEACIQEIYRQARIEFTRPTASRAAVSGIARKFEFAQTDRALSAFAQQIARFEENIDWLVGKGLDIGEDELSQIAVTAPDSFDVEDLQEELRLAIDAITQLEVGPTAERHLRMRAVEQLLPNLPEDEKAQIEQDLSQIDRQSELMAQSDAEMLAAAGQS